MPLGDLLMLVELINKRITEKRWTELVAEVRRPDAHLRVERLNAARLKT